MVLRLDERARPGGSNEVALALVEGKGIAQRVAGLVRAPGMLEDEGEVDERIAALR
jgi:hypothetical protein